MPLTVGSIVQHSYLGRYNANRFMLVTNWKVVSTTSIDTLLVDLNAFNTAMKDVAAGTPLTTYRACLANNCIVTTSRAQVVRPARTLYAADFFSLAGTFAAPASTGNIAATFTRVSQAAGRKGISTSHVGPIADAASALGVLDPTFLTILDTMAARFIQDVSFAAGTILVSPVILHPLGAIIASTDIVTYRLGSTTRVMRRRTVGVGE